MDDELIRRLEMQRVTVAALRAALAPRREAEARALAELEARLSSVCARLDAGRAALHEHDAAIVRARAEAQALSEGLSKLRRRWVTVFEPALASVLLFVGILAVGVTWPREPHVAVLAVAGLVVGRLGAEAWRRWGRG